MNPWCYSDSRSTFNDAFIMQCHAIAIETVDFKVRRAFAVTAIEEFFARRTQMGMNHRLKPNKTTMDVLDSAGEQKLAGTVTTQTASL
jgi:hypothetical protein